MEPVWPVVRGWILASSVGSDAIEKVVEAAAAGTWSATGKPCASAFLITGVVGGCGSAIVAEFLNLYRLPQAALRRPLQRAPASIVVAIVCSLIYAFILRDLMGTGWFAALGLPLASKRDAVAILSLFTVAINFLPAAAINDAVHAALEAVPGWRTVIEPEAAASDAAVANGKRAVLVAGVHDLLGYAVQPVPDDHHHHVHFAEGKALATVATEPPAAAAPAAAHPATPLRPSTPAAAPASAVKPAAASATASPAAAPAAPAASDPAPAAAAEEAQPVAAARPRRRRAL